MVMLDAFPFDNELEIVENVCLDEDCGYYDPSSELISNDEVPGYDIKKVTTRRRGFPSKKTRRVSKRATDKPKKGGRKPALVVPDISDPIEHNGSVQRSFRNRGKVQSYRLLPERKHFYNADKRSAIEAIRAGMSLKKAAKIYKLREHVLRNTVEKIVRHEKPDCRADVEYDNNSSNNTSDVLESGNVDSTSVSTESDMTRLTRSKVRASNSHDPPGNNRLGRVKEPIGAIRGGVPVNRAAEIHNIRDTSLKRKLKIKCPKLNLKIEVGSPAKDNDIITEAIHAIQAGRMTIKKAAAFYRIPRTSLRRQYMLVVGNVAKECGSNDQGGDPGCSENSGLKERFGDPDAQKDGTTNALNQLRDQDSPRKLSTDLPDGIGLGASESVRNQSSDNRRLLRDREQFKVDNYYSSRKKYSRRSYSPQSLRKAIKSYRAGISMAKAAKLHNVSLHFLSSELREAGLLPSTSRKSTVESPVLKVNYASVSEPPKSRNLGCDGVKDGALLSEIENNDNVWNTHYPSRSACYSEFTGSQDLNMLPIDSKAKDSLPSKDCQESMTVPVGPQPPGSKSLKECEVLSTPLGNTLPLTGEVNGCSSVEGREVPATSMISHPGAQTDDTGFSGRLVDDRSPKTGKTYYSNRSKNCKNISTGNEVLGGLDDRAKTDKTDYVRRLRSSNKSKSDTDDGNHFNEDRSMVEPKISGYGVTPRVYKLYTQEMLSMALEDVKAGRKSCQEAAKHFCIPYTTLRYKLGLLTSHSNESNLSRQESFGPSIKRRQGRPWNSGTELFQNYSKTGDDSSDGVKHLSCIKSSDTMHSNDTSRIKTDESGGLGHPRECKTQNKRRPTTQLDKIDKTGYLRYLRPRKTIRINTCDHPDHWKNESRSQITRVDFGPQLFEQNISVGFEMAQEDTKTHAADHYNIPNVTLVNKHRLTGLRECQNEEPLASASNVTSYLEQFSSGQPAGQNFITNDSCLEKRRAKSSFSEMRKDKSQILKCASCDYETPFKSNLKRHVIKHLPENWLNCPKCDFAEENSETFYKHYLSHDEFQTEVYPCPYCRFTSWEGWYLMKHMNYHRKYPDVYDCGECDFSTSTADCLVRHELICHPRDQDKIERTGNLRQSEQADVSDRVRGGLVGFINTGDRASSHKQYMEALKMPLADMEAGRMSCSEAASHYNIPSVTLLNKERLYDSHESGHAATSSNESATLKQSGDSQSGNQNDSIADSGLGETVPGDNSRPTAKRGRGRPRKGTRKVKRRWGRTPTLNITAVCSPELLPLANVCRPDADVDLTNIDGWPRLDSVPTKPPRSDLDLLSLRETKESLDDQEKIKCLLRMPAASFPELQPMDSNSHPIILEEADHTQHQSGSSHSSFPPKELQTENLVCPVDLTQRRSPQVQRSGSRNSQEPDILSLQSKQENLSFRDPKLDSGTDCILDEPLSSALLQLEIPNHSHYTQRSSDLPSFEENPELPAPASGPPILQMLPEPLVVERTSLSNTVDSSKLCPVPGMPILDRAPPESDVQIVIGIPRGETLCCRLDLPETTESFPTPPILIPVSPVQSAVVVPAAATSPPPTPKSP